MTLPAYMSKPHIAVRDGKWIVYSNFSENFQIALAKLWVSLRTKRT